MHGSRDLTLQKYINFQDYSKHAKDHDHTNHKVHSIKLLQTPPSPPTSAKQLTDHLSPYLSVMASFIFALLFHTSWPFLLYCSALSKLSTDIGLDNDPPTTTTTNFWTTYRHDRELKFSMQSYFNPTKRKIKKLVIKV